MRLVSIIFGVSCSAPELAPAAVGFVPGGVVVDGGIEAEGRALTDGRTLVSQAWSPGESVRILGKTGTAEGVGPARAECLSLFYLGLGDAPDSVLSIGPQGAAIVVDNQYGRRVVDGWLVQVAPEPAQAELSATPAEVPARCTGPIPVTTAIAMPDGLRIVAVEGPIPEGSEVGYRLTVYR
jgi:hypothetical protein